MAEGKPFRRILLKLSGEALAEDGQGITPSILANVAEDVAPVIEAGIQVAIVVGAGNIFRGMSDAASSMQRHVADSMGMLGTVINALALQEAFIAAGLKVSTMSSVPMPSVCEPFNAGRARRLLDEGHVVMFGGGTGNPYFTTDTAAVLRGLEIGADVVMKATKVDGVYDKDPMKYADAVKFDRLTHLEVVAKGLQVMDSTASTMSQDGGLPILVFNMHTRGNILAAARGEHVGTVVEPS
ncbi:MAG: UMP kinase [Nannocystaceae bacterium]|nr:UMP kinase [Nannocystaceae bacterium]